MANGDAAAAVGMDVVPGTADRRLGYDEINKTRDYLANHRTAGTHPASAITTGVFDPARIPATKALVDGVVTIYKPPSLNQYNVSHNFAVLGITALVGDVVCSSGMAVAGRIINPSALAAVGGTWTSLVVGSDGSIGVASSSRRYKKNITPTPLEHLARVREVPVVDFQWRKGGAADVGVIAEQLDEAGLNFLVRYVDERPDGVHYDRLSLAVLGYAQHLEERLSALEARLNVEG